MEGLGILFVLLMVLAAPPAVAAGVRDQPAPIRHRAALVTLILAGILPGAFSGLLVLAWGIGIFPLALLQLVVPGSIATIASHRSWRDGFAASLLISVAAAVTFVLGITLSNIGASGDNLLPRMLPAIAAGVLIGLVLALPGTALAAWGQQRRNRCAS